VDRGRLAKLEWAFISELDRGGHGRPPKVLHQALAEEPTFFVDIMKLVFRAEGDSRPEEAEIPREEQDRASRAYALLRSWRTLPGTKSSGEVDGALLAEWVEEARRMLAEARRATIGDQEIGQMLSGAPFDPDGTWPTRTVRDVIESAHSDELDRGLTIGVYNSRGVVSKSLDEGGAQERSIAQRYEGLATAVEDTAPRTARLLHNIADAYRSDAAREDLNAAVEADLGQ
jgi:hypothetical protein